MNPSPTVRISRPRQPSRGFLYIAVLFTALLVMAAVTAALSISTANLRSESDRSNRGDALRLAESEIHRQAAMLRASASWRTNSVNGVFSAWRQVSVDGVNPTGTSEVRHRLSDVDGDLADDAWDSVELIVHAKVGRGEAAIAVTLASDPAPLDLLRYSLTAADDLRFESGGTLTCERPVQVADDCKTGSSGMLTTPRLECSGSIEMTRRGDLAASSVTMPTTDVVATYIALGTEIPLAAIPQSGSDLIIQDRLLSPTSNPFGAVDTGGVYWFDAAGSKVVLSHCRFDATLAIRNASAIEIEGGIAWTYPQTADVILATDAPIRLTGVEATLDEAARNVNFNPTSTPFRGTLANLTTTDVYPTDFRGVIYTSDDIRVDPLASAASLGVTGCLIGRDVRIDGFVNIRQLDELLTHPPAGLSDPMPVMFVHGSMRRIPSP